MGANGQRRRDERRAPVDQGHDTQRGGAVTEDHGSARNQRIRCRRAHRGCQRDGLPDDGRVRSRCQGRRSRRPDVDLPDDIDELIGLHDIDAGAADVRSRHTEEIGVDGAPDNTVSDRRISNEPGGWGRGNGWVPCQERPDVGGGKDRGEVAGRRDRAWSRDAALINGEIHRPCGIRDERPHAERPGKGVGRARNKASVDAKTGAREHAGSGGTVSRCERRPTEAALGAQDDACPVRCVTPDPRDVGRAAPIEEFAGEVAGKRDRCGGIRKPARGDQRAPVRRVRRVQALAELQTAAVRVPPRERVGRADGAHRGQALAVLGERNTARESDASNHCERNPPLQGNSFHSSYLHVVKVLCVETLKSARRSPRGAVSRPRP